MRRSRVLVSLTCAWYHSSEFIPLRNIRMLLYLSLWIISTSEGISRGTKMSEGSSWYVFDRYLGCFSSSQYNIDIRCWRLRALWSRCTASKLYTGISRSYVLPSPYA